MHDYDKQTIIFVTIIMLFAILYSYDIIKKNGKKKL